MPQKIFIADSLSVVTISLVAILALFSLFCIIYTLYFRNRIRNQGLIQLTYFSGPWIIRISYVLFTLWCGVGEILRLRLLSRRDLSLLKLQENACKYYIVSNLGFSEPCLFLTVVFLLRASLKRPGALTPKWNVKTFVFILLHSLPMIVLQLVVIFIAPKYKDTLFRKLPLYFINADAFSDTNDALCTYPLLSTISLGIFATVLTSYLFWFGRQILHLVINKDLRKRVQTLLFSVSSCFPLRVLLLGLSVLVTPGNAAYNAIVFLSFLSFLCCALLGMRILVYLPVADSLAWRGPQSDIEASDTSSLIIASSPRRGSTDSENRGSISFRVKGRDEGCEEGFVELSLFSHTTPSGSPRVLGWPTIPLPSQVEEP